MAPTIGRLRSVDVCESTVRRVENGPGDGVGLLLRAHDRRTGDQLFGGRDHEDDADDRDVVYADPHDLRMVDVDAFRGRFELPERVDRRERDQTVARGRGDGTLGETDCLVFVERE